MHACPSPDHDSSLQSSAQWLQAPGVCLQYFHLRQQCCFLKYEGPEVISSNSLVCQVSISSGDVLCMRRFR